MNERSPVEPRAVDRLAGCAAVALDRFNIRGAAELYIYSQHPDAAHLRWDLEHDLIERASDMGEGYVDPITVQGWINEDLDEVREAITRLN